MNPLNLLLFIPILLLSETAVVQSGDPRPGDPGPGDLRPGDPRPGDLRPGDPWPSFRGRTGTGRLATELGEGLWTLETRWVHPLGSGYSGIAVGGGLLVTAARHGERDLVLAFDPEDGAQRWHYDLEPTYSGHDGSHDGPIATPALAGGRVFMVGAAGRVAALRLSDGGELWTRHLVEDLGCEPPRYGFASSPAVAGETLVLAVGGEDGALAGFDVASGELLWRSLPDSIYGGSPIVAEIGGEPQVLMLSPTFVAGLDPRSGTILWQEEHGEKRAAMGALSQSVLPLDGERLFIKHSEDRVMVLAVTPGVIGGDGGFTVSHLAESRGLTRSYSPPSAVGDAVYGYTGRLLSAIDPATGEILWRSRPPGDGFLLALDDQLAVLTKTGTLHLGRASRQGWVESDRISLFSDLAWTPPSAAGRSIYARSLGEIARVDLVLDGASHATPQVELPPALEALASELATGGDAEEAVTRFLAGRHLPWIEGEDVLFLWRGEARDVAVAGDMIGIRREEAMHRLAGSDLWWWQTRLDRRSRISYLFLVDNKPTVDPSHRRRVQSTILGPDMNWQRDEPLEMSWFAMPEWPGWRPPGRGHLEWIEVRLPGADAETAADDPEGIPPDCIPPDCIPPDCVPARFPVWLPPGYGEDSEERYPVIYVHHPRALDAGRWSETLDRVVGRTVAPVLVVFLEEAPGDALAETLVPAIDARFRTRAEAGARANVGMGFHALAALTATFRNPGVFGRLGIQSFFGIEQEMKVLTETVGGLNAAELPLRIYLEWGRWDIFSAHEAADVRDSGRWLDTFLRRRGWQVIGGEVPDSTDFASWNNRTDLLLETLFPIDGKIPREALRRWLDPDAETTP